MHLTLDQSSSNLSEQPMFAKRKSLSIPFSIKPGLSRAERLQQSILMQERWRLIQSGVSRKSIRVRGDALYVSNKLHGRVSNSKFEHASIGPGTLGLSQPSIPHLLFRSDNSLLSLLVTSQLHLLQTTHVYRTHHHALATPPAPNGCATPPPNSDYTPLYVCLFVV